MLAITSRKYFKMNDRTHVQMVHAYQSVAMFHESQGRYRQALAQYQYALAVLKVLYHEPHPDIAATYQAMAYLHSVFHEQQTAHFYYTAAKKMRAHFYGIKHFSSAQEANDYLCKALTSKKALQLRLARLEQAIDQGALIDFTDSEDPTDLHSKTPLGLAVDEGNLDLCKCTAQPPMA